MMEMTAAVTRAAPVACAALARGCPPWLAAKYKHAIPRSRMTALANQIFQLVERLHIGQPAGWEREVQGHKNSPEQENEGVQDVEVATGAKPAKRIRFRQSGHG